jgi:hypothetical protein
MKDKAEELLLTSVLGCDFSPPTCQYAIALDPISRSWTSKSNRIEASSPYDAAQRRGDRLAESDQ